MTENPYTAIQSHHGDLTFSAFSLLPTEIRLRIWTLSFLPRILELHSPLDHYADRHNIATNRHSPDQPPAFQSRSYNPAALSVSVEARTAALTVYTVALPLAPEKHRDLALDGRRVLYVSPERDTVILLGSEPAIKVTRLVIWFREQSRAVYAHSNGVGGLFTGLCRIGVSAAQFANNQGAQLLRIIGRDLFYDVDHFFLVIGPGPGCGTDQVPPGWWDGGKCLLREFSNHTGDDDQYKGFKAGVGRQFRVQDKWMVVGKNQMRIASVYFENGW